MHRRSFLTAAAAVPAVLAQTQRDWTGRQPIRYTDPDVIALDKRFAKYVIGNAAIERLWTGARWAEGPAWSGTGAYPTVSLRMDFREPQIAGKFVYHCHILDHEDAGMMAIIQVNPK